MAYKYIITSVVSYLLGSFSISIILSRKAPEGDIRALGSGNAGATNMARVYGIKMGIITVVCDALKAAISMIIGLRLCGAPGLMAAGIACQIGHCFPCYYGFKGGKGVSVGAAIGYAVSPWSFLIAVIVFFGTAISTKKVSLSSILASVSIVITAVLFNTGSERIILAAFSAALLIFQHRGNIQRLIKGTEPDFKAARK